MGTTRDTVKPAKPKSRLDTFKRKGKAKTPVGGSSMGFKMKSKEVGPSLTPSKSKTKVESLTDNKGTGKSARRKLGHSTRRKHVKDAPKYQYTNGEVLEAVNQYKIVSQARKSVKALELDVYVVKDLEQNEDLRMKVSHLELQVLKTETALLRRLEKRPGDRCFVTMSEYGTDPKHKIEFLIVSPYGMTLHEIMKKVTNGPLSVECAFVVGLQMLKAIKDLHSIGYLHRNIRPSAFTCGVGETAATVYLQDFRAVRKFEEQKKHVTARNSVKKYGTQRFCSRGCASQKDQGRKDDLESWLYTLFYIMDNNSLSWKCETNKDFALASKESFMQRNGKDQFVKAPMNLAPVITTIYGYEFAAEPDYELIRKMVVDIQHELKLNPTACDWKGKPGVEEIDGDTNRTADCRVTGERDAIVKGKKKKPTRKKLAAGDIIISQGAPTGWKVINLLGSGGFGDVYKVHGEKEPPSKCYALKTESEDGEKRYLRLKVEVTVMMKTAEKKKESKFEHFIEFIDRGKCEELKCKFVVMGLVGPSLEDIRRKYLLAAFSKHTAFNTAVQTCQAVKDLHSIGYLHRDIKPANYAVGLNDAESTIYMLDFGIAKLFVDENGNHKTPRKKVKFLGTPRYAARACMLQVEQGRKDDLETWLYLIFDVIDASNGMPWKRLIEAKEILKAKQEFFKEFSENQEGGYSDNLRRLKDLVLYIDRMQYDTTPDYDYILTFVKTVAKDVNAKITRKLDWIGKLNKKEFDSESEKSEKKQSADDEE